MLQFLIYFYFIVIPVVVFGTLFINRRRNAYAVARDIGFSLVTLLVMVFFLRWDITSIFLRTALIPAFCIAALITYLPHIKRLRQEATKLSNARKIKSVIFGIALPLGMVFALLYRADGGATKVNFSWPMQSGRYFIAQGGTSEWLNHHNSVSAQRFALDITALGRFGRRAKGMIPSKFEAYYINGADVLSPCKGTVVALERGVNQETVQSTNRDAPAGNYVAIYCRSSTVVLAHFAKTAPLEVGQVVAIGDVLGQVGSTGNSTEPHLHIHAVAGEERNYEAMMFTAKGVEMVFDGRILRRNDIFESLEQ